MRRFPLLAAALRGMSHWMGSRRGTFALTVELDEL